MGTRRQVPAKEEIHFMPRVKASTGLPSPSSGKCPGFQGSELPLAQLSTDLTPVWCPRNIQGAPEHELEPGGTAQSGLSRLLLGRAREQTCVTWRLCRPGLLCLNVSTPHGNSRPLQMIDSEEMRVAVSVKLCLQTLKSRSHDFYMLPNMIIFLF